MLPMGGPVLTPESARAHAPINASEICWRTCVQKNHNLAQAMLGSALAWLRLSLMLLN